MQELESARFELELPERTPFDVVGMGLNAVDWILHVPRYPRRNEKVRIRHFRRLGGGQVATSVALCARYGLKARYVGRVGDDEIGEFSLQDMRREPMDTELVEVVSNASSQYAIIVVDDEGRRTIFWDRDEKLEYRASDIRREWIVTGKVLHLDGHDEEAAIRCAKFAREAGMKVCLDIDKVQARTDELLALTDFAIPSEHCALEFTGTSDWRQALRGIGEACPGFAAITRDRDGCAALWEGRIFEIPSFPVAAVDSTGAGDVFHGAFIYALLQGWSVGACLRFANAAGALSCTRPGARGGIPDRRDVEILMESRKGQD